MSQNLEEDIKMMISWRCVTYKKSGVSMDKEYN